MTVVNKVVLTAPKMYDGDRISFNYVVKEGPVTMEWVIYIRSSDGEFINYKEKYPKVKAGEVYEANVYLYPKSGCGFCWKNGNAICDVCLEDGTKLKSDGTMHVSKAGGSLIKCARFYYEIRVQKEKCSMCVKSSNTNYGTVSPSGNLTYAAGTNVKLTATPKSGCTFLKWWKCVNGSWSVCGTAKTITVTKSTNSETYEADFARYTLESRSDNKDYGTVSPSGTSAYAVGTSIKLTATPKSGCTFLKWWKCVNGSWSVCGTTQTITVTKGSCNEIYEADFGRYTLECRSNNTNYGTVSPSGTAAYAVGTSIKLTATPKSGCTFLKWWKCVNGSWLVCGTNKTITVTKGSSNEIYEAEFKKN